MFAPSALSLQQLHEIGGVLTKPGVIQAFCNTCSCEYRISACEIYLDNCCLQRPLDDQTYPRIRVETEAVFVILAAVQAGALSLLGSEALDYEVQRIPDETRCAEVVAVLALASEYLQVTEDVESLAHIFEQQGIRAMDAVHLALASIAKADFFCTCDDKLFRKAQALEGLSCKVTTLLGIVPEATK